MAEATLPLPAKVHAAVARAVDCVWPRGGRVTRRSLALGLLLFAAGAAAEERETAAAREQARLCERKNLEEGAAACRQALALGIGPERRGPVRTLLARHLVAFERWDELAELLREDVRADPASALAWRRLGFTLLFALGEAAEAVGALEEAARLAPADAESRLGLGLALHATGRLQEALVALEEALKVEPSVLDGRPGARAVLDALRRGEPWP